MGYAVGSAAWGRRGAPAAAGCPRGGGIRAHHCGHRHRGGVGAHRLPILQGPVLPLRRVLPQRAAAQCVGYGGATLEGLAGRGRQAPRGRQRPGIPRSPFDGVGGRRGGVSVSAAASEAVSSERASGSRGVCPTSSLKVCIPWEDNKKKLKAAALLRRVDPVKYFSDVQRPPRKPSGPRFSSKPVGVAGGIAKQPSREGQSLDERTHLVSLLLQSVSLEVASCDRSPVVLPQCQPWGLAEIPCWTTLRTCASHFGQLGRALLFWCVFNVYFSLSFSGWLLQPSSRTWRRSCLGSIWPQR